MMSNPLTLWVAASLVAYTLAANAAWYGWTHDREHAADRTRGVIWRAAVLLVRVAFFVGVPYLALIRGVVTPAQFALLLPDWSVALNVAAPLTLGAFIVVSLLIGLHARTLLSRYPAGVFPAVQCRAQLSQPWGASFLLLDALCLQAHWMFYRAGAAAFFNQAASAGVVGGIALVLIEWMLDPRWLHDVRRLGRAEGRALVLALAIFSAVFMASVGNFWLLLLSHVALWLGWLWLMQAQYKPRAARET